MNQKNKIEYSQKALFTLAATIGKDEEAFNWLIENDNKELAALADVLVYGQQDALEWLKTNGFNNLVSFIGALQEDDDSIEYLMNNDGKKWAATAEMVNGSETAPDWLQKFFPAYGALGDSLIENSGTGGGGGIGGFGGGGGGGGGGFGGFGGGSFGGGGGGGHW